MPMAWLCSLNRVMLAATDSTCSRIRVMLSAEARTASSPDWEIRTVSRAPEATNLDFSRATSAVFFTSSDVVVVSVTDEAVCVVDAAS